ncbi:FkbM family methyltransferase [Halobaculum sp. EA56]|uniref:FkbM family methyltransferase n=1 Tax=Halobaculum sp. EA56 TaxID=3421648 RepID=UPI003EB8EA8E
MTTLGRQMSRWLYDFASSRDSRWTANLISRIPGSGRLYNTVVDSNRPSELEIRVNELTITVDLDYEDGEDLPPAHPLNWFYPRYADGTPHEPALSSHFVGAIRPGDVVFDCGSHVGYFGALAAKKLDGDGTIVSIEPAREREEHIRRLVEDNNSGARSEVLTVAAGESDGEMKLEHRGEWKHLERAGIGRSKCVDVPSRSLDSIADEYGTPDVVKIDIEGGELSALRGASDVLDSDAVVFCEVHPNKIEEGGVRECIRLLSRERECRVVESRTGELSEVSETPSRREPFLLRSDP